LKRKKYSYKEDNLYNSGFHIILVFSNQVFGMNFILHQYKSN